MIIDKLFMCWNVSIHDFQNMSINQSINRSINQSINQSIDQLINQSIDQSINQLIDQSINQSINQSIHRSIMFNWSIKQPSLSIYIINSMSCCLVYMQTTIAMAAINCERVMSVSSFPRCQALIDWRHLHRRPEKLHIMTAVPLVTACTFYPIYTYYQQT